MKKEISTKEKLENYLLLNKGYLLRHKGKIEKGLLTVSLPVLSLGSAFAQCQGSQVVNFNLPPGAAGVPIDLDGDNVDDFRIFDDNGTEGAYLASLFVDNIGTGGFLTAGGSGTVKNYPNGAAINGASGTGSYGGLGWLVFRKQSPNDHITGGWADPYPTSGYIGVLKDGKYGFIQLTVHSGPIDGSPGINYNITISEAGLADAAGAITAGTCPSLLLPVELISFNAKNHPSSNSLFWQTGSEINNAGFEVQRSMDSKNWKNLSFIEGKGTTDAQQDYVYEDKDLRSGQLYYYRLKQIDFDGQFEYSEVISARTVGKEIVGAFAPNPAAGGQTNLSYTTAEAGDLQLSVFDVSGKEVFRQNHAVVSGTNNFDLNLSDLDAGMFFVKMQQGAQTVYEKVVIE